jgi:glycosyltransferase involved in cell wall biosynthesis
MRLMFLTSSLAHGGAEHHSITLANRLAERGHECHLAWVKPEAAQLARVRLGAGGSTACLGAARYLDGEAVARLAAALERQRPAAVIAANPYALMYAARARARVRARMPLVIIYHSTRCPGLKEQAKLLAYRLYMWAAERAVFVCEYQRRYCARRGLRSRRNAVIHNGVDIERFRDAATAGQRRQLRAALGFRDRDYVLGVAGGLRPEKNQAQLLEAVARLRGRGLPARALLIGDGPTRGAIEARAGALGITSHVTISGFHDDIRPLVGACDVMCVCSLTEALSLAALESMAMSRPLVHSRVGGAGELIEHGRDGLLFPVADTHALVECLARLADGGRRAALGSAARATVEARFSEARMVDRYEELLGEVSA